MGGGLIAPLLFELHRAGIAQCGVQTQVVVPEQPGNRLVLCVTSGNKALVVQALHLQQAEQRFAAGIVPEVAAAAHGAQPADLALSRNKRSEGAIDQRFLREVL